MGHPDHADHPAGAHAKRRLVARARGSDRFDDAVGADPLSQLPHSRSPLLAALGDDDVRSELAGDLLPVGVAAHGDHLLRPQLLGRKHRAQPHCAVADDGNARARPRERRNRAVPPRARHVRKRQKAGDEVAADLPGNRNEGAVGVGHADLFCLTAVVARSVLAVCVGALAADGARVVARPESADDELASSTTPTYSWPIGVGSGTSLIPR